MKNVGTPSTFLGFPRKDNYPGVLDGPVTREQLHTQAFELILDTASGTLTWSEAAGETTKSISRLGPHFRTSTVPSEAVDARPR